MSADVLPFRQPQARRCALCDGTLVSKKSWHRYHLECWHWLRATRFVLGADVEFRAMRSER